MVSGKKQREVYVGNLTIGAVTDQMLRELFNGALAHLVIDPVNNPAVVNASLDPSGARPGHWRHGAAKTVSANFASRWLGTSGIALAGTLALTQVPMRYFAYFLNRSLWVCGAADG